MNHEMEAGVYRESLDVGDVYLERSLQIAWFRLWNYVRSSLNS